MFVPVPTCCSAYFCGCFDVGYQYAAADDRDCGILDGLLGFFFFPCWGCLARYLRSLLPPPLADGLTSNHTHRGKIREKYNIDGSLIGDILAIWCCGCCAVSQQSRELKHKGAQKYSCF